jgi:type IV pilus assembly protein PilV
MEINMSKQNGFTMLEVLVTMAIVSFGLLGIAGIIANGLKSNGSSYARSQASWMANDIIDSMRANRAAAELSTLPYNLAIGANPTGTSVASSDLSAWRDALADALPAGTGGVAVNSATKKVTVTIQWDDSRAVSGNNTAANATRLAAQTQQFTVETRL